MTAPVTRVPTRRLAAAAWRRRTLARPAGSRGRRSPARRPAYSLITVHRGDTLSAIALRYHTTVARLVALNHLPGDGDLIYAGQTLRVPGPASSSGGGGSGAVYYTVRPGDTLDGIAARFHVAPTASPGATTCRAR